MNKIFKNNIIYFLLKFYKQKSSTPFSLGALDYNITSVFTCQHFFCDFLKEISNAPFFFVFLVFLKCFLTYYFARNSRVSAESVAGSVSITMWLPSTVAVSLPARAAVIFSQFSAESTLSPSAHTRNTGISGVSFAA